MSNTNAVDTTRSDETLAESTKDRPLVALLMDIFENQNEILLVADLPGVAQEQVTIDLHRNRLTLSAKRGDQTEKRMPESEFGAFEFYRSFVVPQGLDAEKITAELSNGVLRVHLPKAAQARPRRIEVRGN